MMDMRVCRVTAGGLASEMSEERVDIWGGGRVSECTVMLQIILSDNDSVSTAMHNFK